MDLAWIMSLRSLTLHLLISASAGISEKGLTTNCKAAFLSLPHNGNCFFLAEKSMESDKVHNLSFGHEFTEIFYVQV